MLLPPGSLFQQIIFPQDIFRNSNDNLVRTLRLNDSLEKLTRDESVGVNILREDRIGSPIDMIHRAVEIMR